MGITCTTLVVDGAVGEMFGAGLRSSGRLQALAPRGMWWKAGEWPDSHGHPKVAAARAVTMAKGTHHSRCRKRMTSRTGAGRGRGWGGLLNFPRYDPVGLWKQSSDLLQRMLAPRCHLA